MLVNKTWCCPNISETFSVAGTCLLFQAFWHITTHHLVVSVQFHSPTTNLLCQRYFGIHPLICGTLYRNYVMKWQDWIHLSTVREEDNTMHQLLWCVQPNSDVETNTEAYVMVELNISQQSYKNITQVPHHKLVFSTDEEEKCLLLHCSPNFTLCPQFNTWFKGFKICSPNFLWCTQWPSGCPCLTSHPACNRYWLRSRWSVYHFHFLLALRRNWKQEDTNTKCKTNRRV